MSRRPYWQESLVQVEFVLFAYLVLFYLPFEAFVVASHSPCPGMPLGGGGVS